MTDGKPENWQEIQHETINRRKRIKELVKLADSNPNYRLVVADVGPQLKVMGYMDYYRVVEMEEK